MPRGFRAPGFGSALVLVATLALNTNPVAAQPTPVDTLTFDAARERVRAASPSLRAADLEVDARRALAAQAGRRPNPTLVVDGENLGGAGAERPQATLSAELPVELGGDRSARRGLAATEVNLATADLALAGLALDAAVRARYAEAAAAQATAAVAAEAVALADTARAVTAEQVAAGDRSPVDETRAEVDLAEAQAEAARAEATRRAAFAALAALWGARPDFATVAPFDAIVAVPPFEALAARLTESPAVARMAAETARRAAVVRLERARRVPDPTISAGYRRLFDPGAGAFVVGLALPLPVFDGGGGSVEAARARLAAGEAERDAVLIEARVALAAAYGDLAAAAAEAQVLRTEALPRAADVAERIDEGYREGKFALLDVLDARRTLVALRLRYTDALAAYVRAAADVARLLGLADLSLPTSDLTPDQP